MKSAVKSKRLTHVSALVERLVGELSPEVTSAKRPDGQHHRHRAQSDAEDDGDVLLRTVKPRRCQHTRKQTNKSDYTLICVFVSFEFWFSASQLAQDTTFSLS